MYNKLWKNQSGGGKALIGAIIFLLLLCPCCAITGVYLLRATAPIVETAATSVAPTRPAATETTPAMPIMGTLTVHYIDVGQGDATLLQGPDFNLLIDAGRHDRNDVLPYLQSAGITSLDLLVATHGHADHIGQFPQVLEALPVGEVWLSGDVHTTQTFERAIDAILASDAPYHEPRAGEIVGFGSARVEVLHPETLGSRLHDNSIALRIVFGEVAFVFTGDAEVSDELSMIAREHTLRADVLQLGHHGSRTSSDEAFLRAVDPDVAIYSAALDNSYGHPHAEVLERLARLGISVYGTDTLGTIRVITDGESYLIEAERGGQGHVPSFHPSLILMAATP